MARFPEQDVSGVRRAIRQGVPSRSGIGIALVLGLLAFVSTVLRAMGGMDPDEAAARGVAGGIGVFAGLLAANALMTLNLSASYWFERHVSEPWLERVRRRYTAIVAELRAAGLDTDAGTSRQKRTLPLLSWFFRLVIALALVSGVAFMLALIWSVDRALLAAGGIEPSGAPLAAVVLVGIPGVLSFAIFQIPLVVITLQVYRLDRAWGEFERSLAHDETGAPDRPRAPALQWPALVEPIMRRLGPIHVPVWRQPQPDAR